MSNLKFVDTHNMVAFLKKPTKSVGFEEIVDFLNANPIKYALTINPTIYTSCIKQFWATAKAKTINGEVQLHAPVDGKKLIITESTVRRDLQLEDAEGVNCLPNATIFEQLTLMGPKTTAWNEFSSTMASAIICLATNQKFNFSKLIFESMVKNLDNVSRKFLMYPRFVQVILDKQLEGISNHKRIYVTPAHTKKIFGNIKRVGKGFSGNVTPLFQTMVVQNQQELGEGSVIPTDPQHTPTILHPSTSIQPQKTQKPRKPIRKNTKVPQPSGSSKHVAYVAVYKERDAYLVRAVTTASSLEAEQDSGNINKTGSKATLNEPSSLGTSSGVNIPRSDKDRLKLKELMEFCTKLQQRIIDLENTKTAQAQEITSLKLRVKKLEKKRGSRTHKLKRLYKVGSSRRVESSEDKGLGEEDASKQGRKIDNIDKDAEITLVDETQGRYGDNLMFDTSVLDDEEVFAGLDMAEKEINVAKKEVSTADPVTTAGEVVTTANVEVSTASIIPVSAAVKTVDEEMTLDQTLMEIKSTKPKAKRIVMQEPKPEEPKKKKDQIKFDEEVALKLQAQFEEEERLAREIEQKEEEAKIKLINTWDDIQARIDADGELAERLQAQEQEELTDEEKARLFLQLLEARRKHFAAKRAEEKRNKPPTRAQQRSIMCTYLKNIERSKIKDFKGINFDTIQEMFDKAYKRINTFEDFREELVEGSNKRAGADIEQEVTKKPKVDDDKETTELK
ncbi:hypothetical protein Tco_0804209 [Tanacetum coccineum]|uniref:Xylulose kinase-1 n=1 Tax=Tanacetum coccineum TaxID=301880 RepID=A0ABQ5A6A2_9ASTR